MKKLFIISSLLLVLVGCSSKASDIESRNYDETNSTYKDTDNTEKSEAITIAKKVLKEHYSIDNFKIDTSNKKFKVNRAPDNKNTVTGEVYKNFYSASGDFSYQDKIYQFDMLYSMKKDDKFSVVYFKTNLDDSKTISSELEK
ncbi:hypothetical protein [Enterococcus italicus]|uniref:hypothetical protein n=1 Tax=Enterococcus italicus TaxID=246144 RepID=UPI003F480EE2